MEKELEIASAEDVKITFIPTQQPNLESGVYTIELHQITKTSRPITANEVKQIAGGQDATGGEKDGSAEDPGWEERVHVDLAQAFHVSVPALSFDPQDIRAVFPPAGSSGDHTHVLPHIVLRRSSLPWERHPEKHHHPTNEPKSWLVLLLFYEQDQAEGLDLNEIAAPKVMKLSELREEHRPKLPPGKDSDEESVSVIHVPRALLEQLLPSAEELRWLAHARQVTLTGEQGDRVLDEAAVVIGSRLPHPNGMNIAHVVSLEGRCDADGNFIYDDEIEADGVPLISLKTWRFTCLSEKKRFIGLVQHLNKRPLPGLLPADLLPPTRPQVAPLPEDLRAAFKPICELGQDALLRNNDGGWEVIDGAQRWALGPEKDGLSVYRLDPCTTLRRPPSGNADADAYLALGCVPLAHTARQGNRSVSWYHGPLIPGASSTAAAETLPLPAACADALVQYNPEIGMFDVSLAAAWELGRLLTLRSQKVAAALFNWKLSNRDAPGCPLEVPPAVREWFEQLASLQDVPFHYLVADELLLPPESLRFFQVDRQWRAALLDGAFSIGRVLPEDADWDGSLRDTIPALASQPMSGFVLRSELVDGYPDLHITGVCESSEGTVGINKDHPPMRQQQAGKDILLGYFSGVLESLVIAQKPEWMHFGFLRGEDGTLRAGETEVPMRKSVVGAVEVDGVVDVAGLAKALGSATSAEFARQMITKTELYRFVIGGDQ